MDKIAALVAYEIALTAIAKNIFQLHKVVALQLINLNIHTRTDLHCHSVQFLWWCEFADLQVEKCYTGIHKLLLSRFLNLPQNGNALFEFIFQHWWRPLRMNRTACRWNPHSCTTRRDQSMASSSPVPIWGLEKNWNTFDLVHVLGWVHEATPRTWELDISRPTITYKCSATTAEAAATAADHPRLPLGSSTWSCSVACLCFNGI